MFATACANGENAFANFQKLILKARIEEVRLIVDNRVEYQYCQQWHMSNREIKHFFRVAHAITGEERSMLYSEGACSISGRLAVGSRTYSFAINAGGVVAVKIGEKEILYGCKKPECDAGFDFGFY